MTGKLTYTDGGDVWVMDGDGGNRVHVIDAGSNDIEPVWSTDGMAASQSAKLSRLI